MFLLYNTPIETKQEKEKMAKMILKANTPDDGDFVKETNNVTEMLDYIIDHVDPSFLFNLAIFIEKDGVETLYAKGYTTICNNLNRNEKELNNTVFA